MRVEPPIVHIRSRGRDMLILHSPGRSEGRVRRFNHALAGFNWRIDGAAHLTRAQAAQASHAA